MKIKLDENIPLRLAAVLERHGHEVDTVHQEGLRGRDDSAVWSAAQAEGRLIITQDLDFSDIRKFAPGSHCGILLVRLGAPGRDRILDRLEEVLLRYDMNDWFGCHVVAGEQRVRIRRP
jgi:predicted nuclease of predicted toxin-antitoxin system